MGSCHLGLIVILQRLEFYLVKIRPLEEHTHGAFRVESSPNMVLPARPTSERVRGPYELLGDPPISQWIQHCRHNFLLSSVLFLVVRFRRTTTE
jgi:hypothetical protein